jgi:allantoin racemase
LVFSTATFGASYIACEASHAVAAHACIGAWADHLHPSKQPLNGVLIGCFGDPGLFALREMSDCPVTGLAEASFIQAAVHGPFSIVTGGERWKPMLERLALSLGYGQHLRHIETVVPSGAELQANPQMAIECLQAACQKASKLACNLLFWVALAWLVMPRRFSLSWRCPSLTVPRRAWKCCFSQQAPRTDVKANSSFANWTGMPEAIQALKIQ